ncbi:MAG TPA: hypothetical protein PKJ43_00880, partial [Prolixibacteraceae bacterium]|nr:hypothetical protein [Prolixibacteraceae bacterium]
MTEIKKNWKIVGVFLLFAAIVLAIVSSLTGLKVTLPVFAIFSKYIEAKYFAFFSTNFTDELVLLLFIAGLMLIVFCGNKKSVDSELLRGKAMFRAVLYNSFVLIFSILFLYGQGFFAIMVFNLFSTLLIYL